MHQSKAASPFISDGSTSSKPSKSSGLISQTIRNLDKFGYPITMTFDKQQTYKTVFGGTMSIISVMCLISFLGVSLHKAITQGEYRLTNTHRIRDVYSENIVIPLDSNNFDYAV